MGAVQHLEEISQVSVGKLKHNFEAADRNVLSRTEAVRQSEISDVSVWRLRSSFEDISKQRQLEQRSFLSWKSSNLSLRPRAEQSQQPPESPTSTYTDSLDQHQQGEKEDSLSVESLESLSEEDETVRTGATSAREFFDTDRENKTNTIATTSDTKRGRVSVTELKHIFSGKRVEVKLDQCT